MLRAVVRPAIVLIGGTSHAGKSTLAAEVARIGGGAVVSTDSLGRHPGRPWGAVRAHVAEHYRSLSIAQLIEDVTRHYSAVWPQVLLTMRKHREQSDSTHLVLEGSALLPHLGQTLARDATTVLWLTAPRELLVRRIEQESGYVQLAPGQKSLVDKFVARTLAFDELVRRECLASNVRLCVLTCEADALLLAREIADCS